VRALLSGLLAAFSFVAALGFRRFGKRSGDRFFDLFAAAFVLLALNSVVLGLNDPDAEAALPLYGIRLVAFGLILGAIWDKNRG
jgi:hypothetical protein